MATSDMPVMDLSSSLQAAQALLGVPVRSTRSLASGANSQVLAIEAGNTRYALKRYPDWRISGRERCDLEWRSLLFLCESGLTEVPRPIAHDPDKAILILEWLDGERIDHIGGDDLDQAIRFLTKVFSLSSLPAARDFPLASEACLSGREIVRQIDSRRAAFVSSAPLESFLSGAFSEVFEAAQKRAQAFAAFDRDLPEELRCLIPADFGFHNGLRASDGRIRFFDFDYFGWDDPVKLVADFVLHPAMQLTTEQKQIFVARMAEVRHPDRDFLGRFHCYVALFSLRWALIVLNLFRRDRQADGGHEDLMAKRAPVQLAKADAFVRTARDYLRM